MHTYINIHKYNQFIKKRNVYIKFDMPHLYTSITQDSLSCTCESILTCVFLYKMKKRCKQITLMNVT